MAILCDCGTLHLHTLQTGDILKAKEALHQAVHSHNRFLSPATELYEAEKNHFLSLVAGFQLQN